MLAVTSLALYNTELTLRNTKCCGPISKLEAYERLTSDTAFCHLRKLIDPKV